jgi:hypothetical protein
VTEGVLFVLSEPAVGQEASFDHWYDTEHAPARACLPGIRTARRYRAADGRAPGWLALYDLDLEVLETDRYRRLRACRSDREKAVMAALPILDRRTYELLGTHGHDTGQPAQLLVATSLTVAAEHEPELDDWYQQEHIPLLTAIPGWNRIRRFRKASGRGPALLALHELSGPEVFDTDGYRAATTTSWRSRIHRRVIERERRTFTLHKDFSQR